MHELRFIDLDDGALVVTGDDGQRFRVVIDDALRDALRPKISTRVDAPKVAPRAIQQLIRAGKTIDEVITLTGAERTDVVRFEGPVRAERDYLVRQARNVAVRLKTELDPLGQDGTSFGDVIDARLEVSSARGVVWDSWKDEEDGWRVGLSFIVDDIARDALWGFDPKSQALTPLNPTATALSQQGEAPQLGGPRLRAVVEAPARAQSATPSAASAKEPVSWIGAAASRLERATEQQHHETADLLEALRRRRGERTPQTFSEDDDESVDDETTTPEAETPAETQQPLSRVHRFTPRPRDEDRYETEVLDGEPAHTTGEVRAVDVPLEGLDEPADESDAGRGKPGTPPRKTGRAAMPSWDEIVFGTRSDE